MHRTDRRRRLLLLNQLQPLTGAGDAEDAGGVIDPASEEVDREVDDVVFDEFDVSSHILAPDPADKFLAACRTGAAVPRLRIYAGSDSPSSVFSFRRPYALVGRSDRCDLRFDHPDVSYRHAYLQVVGGRLHCFDLASRTGTRGMNGDRTCGLLDTRGRILVGPVTIENFDPADNGSDTSVLVTQRRSAELPPVFLEWPSRNGHRLRTARLEREINLLGWSKACHVRFARESVSRVHASLVVTTDGVWLVDLLGRGGTLLDGKCVVFARLKDGAELQIGTCGFRLRLGEPPRRSRRRERRADVVINQNFVWPGAAPVPASGDWHARSVPSGALPDAFPGSAGHHGSENRAAAHGSENRASAGGGLSEGFVLSLFGQFAEMQRAMFSQTQQHMMFLTQMLSSLHQNQQDLIREDLRRVNEINRELQLLQMQMLQQSAGRPQYRLTAADSFPAGGPGGEARGLSGASPRPENAASPESGEEIVDVAFDVGPPPPPLETALQPDDDSDVVPLCDDDDQSPQPAQPRPAAAPRSDRRGAEQHAWLTERMHRLERERNSRWQQIMSLLTGGRS